MRTFFSLLLLLFSANLFSQKYSDAQLDSLCDYYRNGDYEQFSKMFVITLFTEDCSSLQKDVRNRINVETFMKNIALKKHCIDYDIPVLKFLPLSDIIDVESLFNEKEMDSLKNIISEIRHTGLEVFIITVPDYYPFKNIEEFAYNVLLENRNIRMTKGSLAFLISRSKREIQISTDDIAKLIITDNILQNLIHDEIIPELKEGRYFNGVYKGLSKINKQIN